MTSFATRNTGILFLGQWANLLASQIFLLTLVLWSKGKSIELMIALILLYTVPGAFVGLLSGSIVDRSKRKKSILLTCDTLSLISLMGLTGSIFYLKDETWVPILFICTLIISICNAFVRPTVLALIPKLAEGKVRSAISVYTGGQSAIVVLGQTLSGLLYSTFALQPLFIINSSIYVTAFIASLLIREKKDQTITSRNRESFWQASKSGILYIKSLQGSAHLLYGLATVNFITASLPIVIPFLIEDKLLLPKESMGLFFAGFSLGILLGSIYQIRVNIGPKFLPLVFFTAGMAFLLSGLLRNPVVVAALFVLFGLGIGAINVIILKGLQANVRREFLGRVMSAITALTTILAPIGLTLTGILVYLIRKEGTPDEFGALVVTMGGLIIAAAPIFMKRSLHNLLAPASKGK